jgi:hypothetical protein
MRRSRASRSISRRDFVARYFAARFASDFEEVRPILSVYSKWRCDSSASVLNRMLEQF